VLIALFDDVPLDRGPTYIAPESIREVSRTLAASPDGVDFVNRSTAVQVMTRCEERVALTGKVGDLYVMHPFMLHSSSPNPSGSIRWMSNPVIYTHEPLRFDAPASPVEELVVRALRD
ncbi:MAG: phytanoyl-CoA dioxygenase family protein, partial [Myxococcota bacterium]